MDEAKLKALIDEEVRSSLGYVGKLSDQRRKAIEYYYAQPVGDFAPPEVDGRSQAVSTDLSDVVEWIMPQLMRIFTQSDDVVSCEPQKPQDAPMAEKATAWCNYVLMKQNPGFRILHDWFKDGLLSKNGVVKVFWEEKIDTTTEEYEGLSAVELAMLLQDHDVQIVSQRSYPDPNAPHQIQGAGANAPAGPPPPAAPAPPPQAGTPGGPIPPPAPMLYDVTLRRSKDSSCIHVENVAPEEFLISRQAMSAEDAPFLGQRTRKTLSDLRAMGFAKSVVDDIASDDNWGQYNEERIERAIQDDETADTYQQDSGDESNRRVWLTEAYYRVDFDGDGIAELRYILKAGNKLLRNVEVEDHPFCVLTPIPMPHRFFGRSLYDIIGPIQRVRTAIMRGFLDSTYLKVNPRYAVVEGQVNLDDLLFSTPGGVVRTRSLEAVTPLMTEDTTQTGIQGLQFCDDWRENVTGVTKYNQGTDADSLNKTATGITQIMEASNQRIEMIARCYAEFGLVPLTRKILRLTVKYNQKPRMIRLNGGWTPMDPREWVTDFDLTINVGLGAGNKSVQAGQLQQILLAQAQAIPLGIVQPANVYNAFYKWVQALGFKNAGDFVSQPPPGPPPSPPDPQITAANILAQQKDIESQRDFQIQMAKITQESQDRRWQEYLRTGAQLAIAGSKEHTAQMDTVLSHLQSIGDQANDQLGHHINAVDSLANHLATLRGQDQQHAAASMSAHTAARGQDMTHAATLRNQDLTHARDVRGQDLSHQEAMRRGRDKAT